MDKNKLHILVLAGTTRQGRKSIHAAKFVEEIGKSIDGLRVTLVDPVMLRLPDDGDNEQDRNPMYSQLTEDADGFYIVTPEYNHSYPGSLKRMLDSEYENYFHKPVAIAGVSSGMLGGSRAVQALLAPLRKMGMITVINDVYFQFVNELFSDEGTITEDKRELYTKAVLKAYDELEWMARTLKSGREK